MKQNNTFAFFDVDGTLIKFNSLLHFLEYFFNNYFGQAESSIRMSQYKSRIAMLGAGYSREMLNELYYQNFAGIDVSVLRKFSLQWFNLIIQSKDIFNKDAISRLQYHQKAGHTVVFVSGGFFATLDKLAQSLNVKHVLCINPMIDNGVLTGNIDSNSQTIGKGKSRAIRQFLTTNYDIANEGLSYTLSNCYAYGDHISDYDMLSIVGQAVVVGDDVEMLTIAKQHNWQILGGI